MSITERFIQLIGGKFIRQEQDLTRYRTLALKVSGWVLVLLFSVLSASAFFLGHTLLGTVIIVGAVFCGILMMVGCTRTKCRNRCSLLTTIVTILVFSFIVWSGSLGVTCTMTIGIIPFIATALLGYRKGAIASLSFLGIAAIGLFFPIDSFSVNAEISLILKILFIVSFLSILLLAYLFELFGQWALKGMEKSIQEVREINIEHQNFISNLSHQIRTPLSNIMVIANLLETSTKNEKQRDLIDTIHASTNNLVNVVNSMIQLSNIDIKEREVINVPFSLFNTINSTVKIFSMQDSLASPFQIIVDSSIPEKLVGDPVRVKQLFLNIIESILKNKSETAANISIIVSRQIETSEEIDLFIEVKSDKPLLIPINKKQGYFVTSDSDVSLADAQKYIDMLELSITQKLIESNGGKLNISLTPESASFSFPFSLKKIVSDLVEVEVEPLSTDFISDSRLETLPSASEPINLNNANVLLVEDNVINQKIVVLSLKKLVKNIEIANNGKEALDKFGTSKFDIILMDIQMPIMNGITSTKKIREIEAGSGSHTPIIAITANALMGDKEDCLAAGMDDYISKPFQIEVLIQKMKSLLGSS